MEHSEWNDELRGERMNMTEEETNISLAEADRDYAYADFSNYPPPTHTPVRTGMEGVLLGKIDNT